LTHPRPGARAISPAIGYNQLLSTNSVSLMAEHGDQFIAALRRKAQELSGEPKRAMEQKIEALRRMVAFCRGSTSTAWLKRRSAESPREDVGATEIWIRFGMPCDSMRLATFTASPQMSYANLRVAVSRRGCWPP